MADDNIGILTFDEHCRAMRVADCVIASGEDNEIFLEHGIIVAGRGIQLRPERCSVCRRIYTVVRPPEGRDLIVRCPGCIQDNGGLAEVLVHEIIAGCVVRIADDARLEMKLRGKYGSVVRLHSDGRHALVCVPRFGDSEEVWLPIAGLERRGDDA